MPCHLCLRDRPLLDSHIIPGFVYRWLRESSPTGYMRSSQTPNKRVQDGPTAKLLCSECESLLSGWEKQFAEQIFIPFHQGTQGSFSYGAWALKFAVSISWRVLVWPQEGRYDHLTVAQVVSAQQAAEVWRQFLLDERPHPGAHEQRIIPLNILDSYTAPSLSPFMNRYMTRVIVADIVSGNRTVFTYSKLYRLLILGFVEVPDRKKWIGGKLSVRSGTLGGRTEYSWPSGFFDYMNQSANAGGAALGRMSDRQSQKLETLMLVDIDRVRDSEVFRDMRKDVEFSGARAFALEDLNETVEE